MKSSRPKGKAAATWIAVIAGLSGAHRFYLRGHRDVWAWLHIPPALLGLAGVQRLRAFGQDDGAAWVLLPLLGLMIALVMAQAIWLGLMSDAEWAARFTPGLEPRPSTWAPILGVIVALILGAAALMGTIAYGGQKFFEWQLLNEAPQQGQNNSKLAQ